MTIFEEIREKIEQGYTDKQVATITGWDIEYVEIARRRMANEQN